MLVLVMSAIHHSKVKVSNLGWLVPLGILLVLYIGYSCRIDALLLVPSFI